MKQKHLIRIAFLLISFLLPFMSQASETRVTKDFKIKSFTAVKASQGIDVIFTQAPNPGVARVETSKELAPYLVVRVEGNCLIAKFDFPSSVQNRKLLNGKRKTVVRVSSPTLNSIKMSSAADFTSTNDIVCSGELKINVSSSGDVTIPGLTCSTLTISGSSAGDVEIKSVKGDVSVSASSSSDVEIGSVTGSVKVTVSSAADVSINRMKGDRLTLNSSSGADVKVKNANGETINTVASSGGDISVTGIQAATIKASASSGATITLSGKGDLLTSVSSSGGSVHSGSLTVKEWNNSTNNNSVRSTRSNVTNRRVTTNRKSSNRQDKDSNYKFREP